MMDSMTRTLTTLGHRAPDRVPLFLLTNLQGPKALGLTPKAHFADARNVIESQIRLAARYQSDCLFPFSYASLEIEAWGGESIFIDDGPPNAGAPIIQRPEDILRLTPPSIDAARCLHPSLEAIAALKAHFGASIPIIGTIVSPFSLPAMQMGMGAYLDLIYERPDLWARLMEINEVFGVAWANAQLQAGATAICYFDPVSSPTMLPPALYRQTGHVVARRVLPQIKGPTATHFASGLALPVLDEVIATGTAALGVSALEDLGALKAAARGRLSLLGALNGVEMRRWTPAEAEAAVKANIAALAPGGGFILSDNHGEIPWQVEDETLLAISEAARRWGQYPLTWVDDERG